MDPRLLRLLAVELYAAAQMLKGEEAEEFWKLIDQIQMIRERKEMVRHPEKE